MTAFLMELHKDIGMRVEILNFAFERDLKDEVFFYVRYQVKFKDNREH